MDFKHSKLFLAVLMATSPLHVQGQESINQSQDAGLTLEEVIVTGTAGGAELRQLDAAFSITSLDTDDIATFSPKSTADLLKTIPGVWAESSGGVSGANVFVRGLPSSGDADFLTVSLQGSPIYGASTLSFFEQSSMFRIDETIERVEGLRGGANTIFSNGQAGLTTNFILKSGSETPEGLAKLTVGDYDLIRLDAVHSGPLANGWNYMVGGYVSKSEGIRESGFDSEKGKQLTVNLTKEFDDSSISIYNRYTDDFGQWYLPIPVSGPGSEGLDLGTFTQLTDENRIQVLDVHPTRPEGSTIDLGDGRGWEGNIFGINFDKTVGVLTISNRFNYTSGESFTHGILANGGLPLTVAGNLTRQQGPNAGTSVVGAALANGGTLQATDVVGAFGAWIVEKELDAISNDLAFTAELGSHELTAGFFYTDYSADDVWSLGNDRTFVLGGGRVDGIDTCIDFGVCGATAQIQNSDATTKAFYLHDKWQINARLAIDVGLRRDDHEVTTEFASTTANASSPFNPVTPAPTRGKIEEEETAFTAGVNYNLTDNSSLFFRANRGFDFSQFDDVRGNLNTLSNLVPAEIEQAEIGYKWQGNIGHVYLTLFDSLLKGAPIFVQTASGPVNLGATESEAQGLEVDANFVFGNFSINLNSTLQSTEQVTSSTPSNVGNDAQRLPDKNLRITPSYDFDLGSNLTGTVYGTLSYVDDRFSDPANLQILPSYTKVDLGMVFNHGDNWEYRLVVDNANDEEGFTEGNPRSINSASSTARPILGRSIKASVQYNF